VPEFSDLYKLLEGHILGETIPGVIATNAATAFRRVNPSYSIYRWGWSENWKYIVHSIKPLKQARLVYVVNQLVMLKAFSTGINKENLYEEIAFIQPPSLDTLYTPSRDHIKRIKNFTNQQLSEYMLLIDKLSPAEVHESFFQVPVNG
jgi:hypothetical protein